MYDPNDPAFAQQNASRVSNRGEMAASGDRPMSALDILSEMQQRLARLEDQHAELKKMVNDARERGDVGFDFEHAQHVLTKHFHHDRPEVEAPPAPVAKFDAYTGQPLH